MMTLRKMTEDEFRAFKKFSVADYASDLMKGRDMNPEQALMEAEKEFSADLPDGLDTECSFNKSFAYSILFLFRYSIRFKPKDSLNFLSR